MEPPRPGRSCGVHARLGVAGPFFVGEGPGMSHDNNGTDHRFSKIEQCLVRVDQRLTSQDELLERINTKIDDHYKHLLGDPSTDGLKTRVSRLEDFRERARKLVSVIGTAVAGLIAKLVYDSWNR
jgi:hypothetical protein